MCLALSGKLRISNKIMPVFSHNFSEFIFEAQSITSILHIISDTSNSTIMNSCKTFALPLFALFLFAARPSVAQLLRKSFDSKCQSCPVPVIGREECDNGLVETDCLETTRCCPFEGWGAKTVLEIDTSVTSDEQPVKPPPVVIEDEPPMFSSASIVSPLVSMNMALAATVLFL